MNANENAITYEAYMALSVGQRIVHLNSLTPSAMAQQARICASGLGQETAMQKISYWISADYIDPSFANKARKILDPSFKVISF